ncbi:hypothetical protein AQ505_11625 [Pedobacter sp. PACM 27299]|uniref:quinone oxidoreductase family protein n=1 Tax=Pedobacter sp. PACM 27299 TaxID=1727164 RepID=UPI000706EDE8|nr:zinc-binding alcohol dehydrogenase family protein [Pedobacter sp. PACM 27299]ALL06082.1 hypothetical protein AQ505_11625 [Pedobacter sp. PACM 27299]
MKSAVLNQYGESPKYTEVIDPIPNANEVLVKMVASSIKQIDKSKAAGKHYTKYPSLPAVVGLDGVASLEDGSAVYITGISGTMAEKALVIANSWVLVPEGLALPLAAALPNALIGSDAAMLYRGEFKQGDAIIINGATGATGRIAIQMAKNRGAKCVIALGRFASGLSELSDLGADILIDTAQPEEIFLSQLTETLKLHQPKVVLDYLWGRPAELILKVLHDTTSAKVKFVTVGEMAGATINLPSALLRSRKIELLGSGIGSISFTEVREYFAVELPQAYEWAAAGKVIMPLEIVSLADIESVWQREEKKGKRNVVIL